MAAPTFVQNNPPTEPTSRVSEFPPTSKNKVIIGQLTVDGTVGASVGQIPASTFGLSYIERVEAGIKSDNTLIVNLCPSFDGSSLLNQGAGAHSTANIEAGTYLVKIFGY
jgi:hypothetical protein